MLPDLKNMETLEFRCYYVHTEDKTVIYVLPVHGRHFDFRHGFLSSVIFVIGGNSAVLKNIIPITVSLTIGLLH